MDLSRFIKRPVLSTVISIFIVILGVIGLVTLPVTQYPDIAPPTVTVRAMYPGANAGTVLNSVVAPLEEQINGVENMMYMESSAANNGSATITVYFRQGTDPDMATVNVQNRVAAASGMLPAEVNQIGVSTMKRQSSMLMVFSLVDESDTFPMDFIENYAQINIIPQVKRVSGVGEAFVMGGSYSMRIWLKPETMAQYGLVPTDVAGVLAEQNVEAAPGQFGEWSNRTFQYTIRYKGRLKTEQEFENIVVKALPGGEVLRLGDISDVEIGRVTYGFNNRVNGHKGVTSIAFQLPGSNATETVEMLEKTLHEADNALPSGMYIDVAMSANDFLFASIHEVVKTLIEAFILVFLVVYIFLQDMRSTLIPAIAIPVSLVGTFFVLAILGFSLNLLTLSALVLAIAIVVDDAIVVVEGVHAKLDEGYKSPRMASIDAMSELGGAILSITMVMMAVFIPVSFMGGTAGTFYRQFGLTMAIAIGISALNALTLSPALCAVFLKPKGDGSSRPGFVQRFNTAFNETYDRTLGKYQKRVARMIKNPKTAFAIVIAAIAVLVLLMRTTPTGMVPTEDQGVIMASISLPPGSSQDRANEVMAQVDSLVAAEPSVSSRTLVSGYGFIGGQGPGYGSFIIKLKPWEERGIKQSSDIVYITLFMRAQKIIKDAQVFFFTPPMIPGYSVSNDIEVNMQDKTGGSLDRFYEVTKDFIAKLNARPEIKSAQTTFNPNFPQYEINIDAAACKKSGISPRDILMTLQGYYGGLYASNFNRFGKMYRVMVQARPEDRADLESLNKIKVRSRGGVMAPISQFMDIKKVYGPDIVNRFNLYTSMKVMVSPASGYTSGQVIQAISQVRDSDLATGYTYELGGISREEAETSGSTTAIIFVLCLVFVYLLLSAQYESYILPLSVLLSIPFGLAGSFIFVKIYSLLGSIPALKFVLGSMSNDIYMQIALIMLVGLLAKNAILIVEFAIERRRRGMDIIEAAVQGAGARLRPIMMTSLAMIIGLLPLMLATGAGAHGYRTLGTATIGGMLIGMIFQILVVPVLFVVFQRLQEKVVPMEFEEKEEK